MGLRVAAIHLRAVPAVGLEVCCSSAAVLRSLGAGSVWQEVQTKMF